MDKERISQSDKFKQAARELGCDEDEARFDSSLSKIARAKRPVGKDEKPAKPKKTK